MAETSTVFTARPSAKPPARWPRSTRTPQSSNETQAPVLAHGTAAVTNNAVFTTTYNGHLYTFNAASSATLLRTPLSGGAWPPGACLYEGQPDSG